MPKVNVFSDNVDSYNKRREQRILSNMKSQIVLIIGVALIISVFWNRQAIFGAVGFILVVGAVLFLLINCADKNRHRYNR